MTYDDALRYLLSFADFERTGRFSERPDVEPVRALLRELGDPHTGRITVHVAGSKGKGSVAAMIASILAAAGLRTGLTTSPHLHRFVERVMVDGAPVSPEAFAAAVERLPAAVEAVRRRFPDRELVTFDLITAAAFVAFRDAGAMAQVVEVGLGGRLDATNVFDAPEVCVITPVSLEHTAILGDTVAQIAREKAAIIKRGATVVMGLQRESAADVIRARAAEVGAELVEVARACALRLDERGPDGQRFTLRTPAATYRLSLPLAGRHQVENAATAVLAVEALARRGVPIEPEHVRAGLASVRWPGRLERLQSRPLFLVDGAHNADSARRLAEALREEFGLSAVTFVVGTLAGKDVEGIAREVESLAGHVVCSSWAHPRAMPAPEVAQAFAARDVVAEIAPSVDAAIERVRSLAEGGAICAMGSIAFAAAVRECLLGIESDMMRLQSAGVEQP
ncbi:MAG TPA: folylpolyglutamate synthase/dihydrofolate synthase family protein [Dehalococcoidia bacterium]|nr:folylpolyglutamate synthase/dihydrofolate synthase family protein [Dehalococcoidia bacterium]